MQKIDKTDTLKTILSGRKYIVDYFQREYRWGRSRSSRCSPTSRAHLMNFMIRIIMIRRKKS